MHNVLRFSGRQVVWVFVYAINLFVPILFGLHLTQNGGRLGMLVAVAYLWAIGHIVCGVWKTASFILVSGSVLIGLSQFFPLLQMFAGSFAVELCGQNIMGNQLSDPAAFAVTFVTGAELLAAAGLAGTFFWIAFGRTEREIPPLPPPPPGVSETAVIDLSPSRLPQ